MEKLEIPFVLGTAGHIDHGKTTLVKAISGVDCDRLSAEKKRGITIELGFAPFILPSGKIISIVDVPGHEKFIRQMVAGAIGLDAVMLVVAADDGVMSQTREHLEILSLLGIKKGLVAITKIDQAEKNFVEIVKEEILELTIGTFLENAPIIPVSSFTKEGLDSLKLALEKLVESSEYKIDKGRFFLPVDRVFHMSGFGTVITGTVLKGAVEEASHVEILPSKLDAKVRTIQVHELPTNKAVAGQRVAMNLSNISLDDIKPGDVVASRGHFMSTKCLNVEVSVLRSAGNALKHWERLHLHIGTSDIVVRLSLLDKEKILPGDKAIAQLILEKPVAVFLDMPFILRKYSPMSTVAGGIVLTPLGKRPKNKKTKISLTKYLNAISENISLNDKLKELIEYKEIIGMSELSSLLEKEPLELRGPLSALEMKNEIGVVKTLETILISKPKIEELTKKIQTKLALFHKGNPELQGMTLENAANSIGVNEVRFAKELMLLFMKMQYIIYENDRIRLKEFEPFDESNFISEVSRVKKKMLSSEYTFLTKEELSQSLSINEKEINRIVSYLKEKREIYHIGQGFLVPQEILLNFNAKIQTLGGDLTLANIRDVTKSSRKYILPLLEYFDSIGITRRIENKRIIVKKVNDFQ
ncbi:MAG: selenocysteine-specific translation elongation factor [Synergistaceae bacterium]|nr:selenocysteine-specific translation elongation factor [Synergistaceae bacterium]